MCRVGEMETVNELCVTGLPGPFAELQRNTASKMGVRWTAL